eukprot:TRINITY_DN2672_c1_g1::TRINITY_DN2672_c1_g1_i1::g.26037::m.26037 TRINITY_DN2672_c1_g1::TRINITY_DN2672_c1_g1_i1::g.26037  ORF type:complete len:253 (+),score=16.59,sp/Q0VFV7/KCTD7_DANRE/37.74/2e-09,BTB_2/PF02214.17/5e-13 TRINITY_DN2672_c1_g1_i1:46-759(+)
MRAVFRILLVCMICLHPELSSGSSLPEGEKKSNIPEIIRFNVGGKSHMTTFSTLSSQGENLLTQLVRDHYDGTSGTVDDNGAIFIDRDGRLFRDVLNYLRTGEYPLISDAMRREFEYYAVSVPTKQPGRLFRMGVSGGTYLSISGLNDTDTDLVYFLSHCVSTISANAGKITCTTQGYYFVASCEADPYSDAAISLDRAAECFLNRGWRVLLWSSSGYVFTKEELMNSSTTVLRDQV